MSERREERAKRVAEVAAGVLQAVAVAGAALWFRDAAERYAGVAVLASVVALGLRWGRTGRAQGGFDQRELERGTAVLFVLAALLVATPAVRVARARAVHSPDAAVAEVARAVAPTLSALERTAQTALARAGGVAASQ